MISKSSSQYPRFSQSDDAQQSSASPVVAPDHSVSKPLVAASNDFVGEPPVAAKKPHTRSHHGRTFVDDYEWLRDKESMETRDYLEDENAYTEAMTADQEELRERIYQEIRSRIQETDLSVPIRSKGYWYYSRTLEGKSYGLSCRVPILGHGETYGETLSESRDDRHGENPGEREGKAPAISSEAALPGGEIDEEGHDLASWTPPAIEPHRAPEGEEILLDGNALAEGHDFFSLGAAAMSNKGRLLAYSTDTEGDERYNLRIKDVETGEILDDAIDSIAASVLWSQDDKYLFYCTVDASWRPDTVWRHRLGSTRNEDIQVFHEPDERFWIGLGSSRSERFIFLGLSSMVTSEVWILEADNPTGEFRCVRPRETGIEYDVEHAIVEGEDRFLITHNVGGSDFEVGVSDTCDLTTSSGLASLSDLPALIPYTPGVRVEDISAFSDHVLVSFRRDALSRLGMMALGDKTLGVQSEGVLSGFGELKEISLGEELFTLSPGGNPEFDSPVVRVAYGTFITPATVADYVMGSQELVIRKQQVVLGNYDASEYEQFRLWATADDGERIPISVVRKRGVGVDDCGRAQPVPTLIYGYGSYESSIDPAFSISRLSLLDRGMVFAVAHIRGGGELGREWYEKGKMLFKKNTFTDFIACADHLIHTGITQPKMLVAEGGSAGGLLMGAVANMAPDRFVGIEAIVPFVDPLTSILMPDLPLTVIEWDEWGDPLHDPEVYDYIASYSPYENIKAQSYPNILATTSLNDTRVLYVEPAKWVAKLRAMTLLQAETPVDNANSSQGRRSSQHSILLKTEMNAGHGGVSGRYEKWRETAFEYAWILRISGAA